MQCVAPKPRITILKDRRTRMWAWSDVPTDDGYHRTHSHSPSFSSERHDEMRSNLNGDTDIERIQRQFGFFCADGDATITPKPDNTDPVNNFLSASTHQDVSDHAIHGVASYSPVSLSSRSRLPARSPGVNKVYPIPQFTPPHRTSHSPPFLGSSSVSIPLHAFTIAASSGFTPPHKRTSGAIDRRRARQGSHSAMKPQNPLTTPAVQTSTKSIGGDRKSTGSSEMTSTSGPGDRGNNPFKFVPTNQHNSNASCDHGYLGPSDRLMKLSPEIPLTSHDLSLAYGCQQKEEEQSQGDSGSGDDDFLVRYRDIHDSCDESDDGYDSSTAVPTYLLVQERNRGRLENRLLRHSHSTSSLGLGNRGKITIHGGETAGQGLQDAGNELAALDSGGQAREDLPDVVISSERNVGIDADALCHRSEGNQDQAIKVLLSQQAGESEDDSESDEYYDRNAVPGGPTITREDMYPATQISASSSSFSSSTSAPASATLPPSGAARPVQSVPRLNVSSSSTTTPSTSLTATSVSPDGHTLPVTSSKEADSRGDEGHTPLAALKGDDDGGDDGDVDDEQSANDESGLWADSDLALIQSNLTKERRTSRQQPPVNPSSLSFLSPLSSSSSGHSVVVGSYPDVQTMVPPALPQVMTLSEAIRRRDSLAQHLLSTRLGSRSNRTRSASHAHDQSHSHLNSSHSSSTDRPPPAHLYSTPSTNGHAPPEDVCSSFSPSSASVSPSVLSTNPIPTPSTSTSTSIPHTSHTLRLPISVPLTLSESIVSPKANLPFSHRIQPLMPLHQLQQQLNRQRSERLRSAGISSNEQVVTATASPTEPHPVNSSLTPPKSFTSSSPPHPSTTHKTALPPQEIEFHDSFQESPRSTSSFRAPLHTSRFTSSVIPVASSATLEGNPTLPPTSAQPMCTLIRPSLKEQLRRMHDKLEAALTAKCDKQSNSHNNNYNSNNNSNNKDHSEQHEKQSDNPASVLGAVHTQGGNRLEPTISSDAKIEKPGLVSSQTPSPLHGLTSSSGGPAVMLKLNPLQTSSPSSTLSPIQSNLISKAHLPSTPSAPHPTLMPPLPPPSPPSEPSTSDTLRFLLSLGDFHTLPPPASTSKSASEAKTSPTQASGTKETAQPLSTPRPKSSNLPLSSHQSIRSLSMPSVLPIVPPIPSSHSSTRPIYAIDPHPPKSCLPQSSVIEQKAHAAPEPSSRPLVRPLSSSLLARRRSLIGVSSKPHPTASKPSSQTDHQSSRPTPTTRLDVLRLSSPPVPDVNPTESIQRVTAIRTEHRTEHAKKRTQLVACSTQNISGPRPSSASLKLLPSSTRSEHQSSLPPESAANPSRSNISIIHSNTPSDGPITAVRPLLNSTSVKSAALPRGMRRLSTSDNTSAHSSAPSPVGSISKKLSKEDDPSSASPTVHQLSRTNTSTKPIRPNDTSTTTSAASVHSSDEGKVESGPTIDIHDTWPKAIQVIPHGPHLLPQRLAPIKGLTPAVMGPYHHPVLPSSSAHQLPQPAVESESPELALRRLHDSPPRHRLQDLFINYRPSSSASSAHGSRANSAGGDQGGEGDPFPPAPSEISSSSAPISTGPRVIEINDHAINSISLGDWDFPQSGSHFSSASSRAGSREGEAGSENEECRRGISGRMGQLAANKPEGEARARYHQGDLTVQLGTEMEEQQGCSVHDPSHFTKTTTTIPTSPLTHPREKGTDISWRLHPRSQHSHVHVPTNSTTHSRPPSRQRPPPEALHLLDRDIARHGCWANTTEG